MDAVEQAANAGNYAAAEPLLREAALLQEASLGPLHPDLANTLNNLAVVCELTGKMADAEHFYRRAYAIASTALAPDDDLVATSERNLRDFCETQGLPLELPKPTPIVAPGREVPVAASAPVPIERPSPDVSPPPILSPPPVLSQPSGVGQVSPSYSARPLPVRLLSAAALLLVTLIAGYFWFRADAPGSSSTLSPTQVEANPTPLPPSAPVTPTPVPPAAPPAPSSSIAAPKSPAPRPAPARHPGRGRSTTLQRFVARWHLALRTGEQSSRSRQAVLLHATQGGKQHDRPPSLVPRRPSGSNSRSQDSGERQQRVPHVQSEHGERGDGRLARRADGSEWSRPARAAIRRARPPIILKIAFVLAVMGRRHSALRLLARRHREIASLRRPSKPVGIIDNCWAWRPRGSQAARSTARDRCVVATEYPCEARTNAVVVACGKAIAGST